MIMKKLPGEPYLAYQNGELCLESARLSELARTHGTPLFVYSQAAMLGALAANTRSRSPPETTSKPQPA